MPKGAVRFIIVCREMGIVYRGMTSPPLEPPMVCMAPSWGRPPTAMALTPAMFFSSSWNEAQEDPQRPSESMTMFSAANGGSPAGGFRNLKPV